MGGPTCWQHGKNNKFLRVKDSTIPGAGKGLFVDKPGAKPGEVVFDYHHRAQNGLPPGVIAPYTPNKSFISKGQLEKRYPGNRLATYALEIRDKGETYYANPEKTNDGYARFCNNVRDGDESGKKNKAELIAPPSAQITRNKVSYDLKRVSNPNPKIKSGEKAKEKVIMPYLVLKRNQVLRQGEEVFTEYGSGYWKEKNGHTENDNPKSTKTPSDRTLRRKRRKDAKK